MSQFIAFGDLVFVKDSFFELIDDPYLKTNKRSSARPHYFAIKDPKLSDLYWVVPL